MKKTVGIFTLLIIAVSLTACQSTGNNTKKTTITYAEEELSKEKEVEFFKTTENPFLKDATAAKDTTSEIGREEAAVLLKKSASVYDAQKHKYTGFEEKGKEEFDIGDCHWDIAYKDNMSVKLMVQDFKFSNQGKSPIVLQFAYEDCFLVYQGVSGLPEEGDIVLESQLPKEQLKLAVNAHFSDNASYTDSLQKMVFPNESIDFQVGYELKNKKDPVYQIIVTRLRTANDSYLKVMHVNKIEIQ